MREHKPQEGEKERDKDYLEGGRYDDLVPAITSRFYKCVETERERIMC